MKPYNYCQYPYQDSDEGPLRHAYTSPPFLLLITVLGLYASHLTSQRPCLAVRVVSPKLTNLSSSIPPLPSFPHTSSLLTTRLFPIQTLIPTDIDTFSLKLRTDIMNARDNPSLPLPWNLPYRFPLGSLSQSYLSESHTRLPFHYYFFALGVRRNPSTHASLLLPHQLAGNVGLCCPSYW